MKFLSKILCQITLEKILTPGLQPAINNNQNHKIICTYKHVDVSFSHNQYLTLFTSPFTSPFTNKMMNKLFFKLDALYYSQLFL